MAEPVEGARGDAGLDGTRLDDADLWRAVEHTVHHVLLPTITDDWARAVAVQLVGLIRYAAARPADPTGERLDELVVALDALRGNEIVDAAWTGDTDLVAVHAAVGVALAVAVVRTDSAAAAVRDRLRPIVVRQLDDELAATAPLVAAFRGQL